MISFVQALIYQLREEKNKYIWVLVRYKTHISQSFLQEPYLYNTGIIFIIIFLLEKTSLRKSQILAKGYRAKMKLEFKAR